MSPFSEKEIMARLEADSVRNPNRKRVGTKERTGLRNSYDDSKDETLEDKNVEVGTEPQFATMADIVFEGEREAEFENLNKDGTLVVVRSRIPKRFQEGAELLIGKQSDRNASLKAKITKVRIVSKRFEITLQKI